MPVSPVVASPPSADAAAALAAISSRAVSDELTDGVGRLEFAVGSPRLPPSPRRRGGQFGVYSHRRALRNRALETEPQFFRNDES
jgi:hypothetical protein